ncbi:MAG: hypothetical protein U1D30_21385 [Planctomycetota bacterium]
MKIRRLALLALWAALGNSAPVLAQQESPTVIEEEAAGADTSWNYQSYYETINDHLIYFEMGALWLARNSPDNIVVGRVVDQNLNTIQTATTNEFGTCFEPGMKVLMGFILDSDTRVEVSYFGLNEWFRRASLETSNENQPIASPYMSYGILPAGPGATADQQYAFDSQVNNVELNLKRFMFERGDYTFSTLAGFRWFNLQEAMIFNQSFVVAPADFPSATGESTTMFTHNHLVGLQIGGELLEDLGPLQLGVQGTAGAFANFGSMKLSNLALTNGPSTTIFDSSKQGTEACALGQVSFTAEYMMFENVALRGGYDLLFISGLAFAPNQLEANVQQSASGLVATGVGPATIKQDGFGFYHGPSITLVIFW